MGGTGGPEGGELSGRTPDERLRAALRAIEAAPEDPDALAAAVAEHARAGRALPAAVLRRTAAWRPLVAFVARWYERPLSDEDGCPELELDECERRLGPELPLALREWFAVAGRRLSGRASRPRDLRLLAGDVCFWDTSDGPLRVQPGGDDPLVGVGGDGELEWLDRLTCVLVRVVFEETLAAAAGGAATPSLGRLAAGVCGGQAHDLNRGGIDALRRRFLLIPAPWDPDQNWNPWGRGEVLGDGECLLRLEVADRGPSRCEWLAATAAGRERVARCLGGG